MLMVVMVVVVVVVVTVLKVDNIKMPKCCFRSRLPPTSELEPHVQKSRLTAPATKSEHCACHEMCASTLSACYEKSTRATNARGFRCACHEK